MAKMTPTDAPVGFMELLRTWRQMEQIMEILRRTYFLCGFTPWTPR